MDDRLGAGVLVGLDTPLDRNETDRESSDHTIVEQRRGFGASGGRGQCSLDLETSLGVVAGDDTADRFLGVVLPQNEARHTVRVEFDRSRLESFAHSPQVDLFAVGHTDAGETSALILGSDRRDHFAAGADLIAGQWLRVECSENSHAGVS